MKTIIFAALFLVAAVAQGDTQEFLRASKLKLNSSSPNAQHEAKLGNLLIDKKEHVLRAVYDFSVLGGAVSTVSLRDASDTSVAAKLPKGAIVRDCIIDVITAPTSGGSATIALGTGASTTDLKAATAIASYSGLHACVPVGTAASAIKLTSDQTMSATIATAALTAGKIYVVVHYELSDTQ